MRVLAFPVTASGNLCTGCERPTAEHEVNGRWVGCSRDVVIGQDQERLARRLRLAALQPRVVKVRPFGIDVEGIEAR